MDVPRTQSLAAATLPWVLLFITTACGSERPGEPEGGVDELDPISVPRVVPLNLLFVHGVSLDPDGRMRADESLAALEAYLLEAAQPLMETYEREHPGVDLQLASRRVNLYTGPDGQPLVPTIDQPSDGTGVPAATAWRTQLVQKLEQAYPNGERNILLVGHSTGARVAMEVAAHVGGNGGPGSFDWGVQDRIAGVVTMNGMLDALQKREYNFLATLDFVSGCNVAQEAGWCEYAGLISGVPAADWVAENRRALMLTSSGACSPSLWTGENDQALPLRAQGSPNAFGMKLTPAPGATVRPAHGLFYGEFCHSDMTQRDSPRHADAVARISTAVLDWLFVSAPRPVNRGQDAQQFDTEALAPEAWSERYAVTAECPTGELPFGPPDLVGTCLHPGYFDADDHPLDVNNETELAQGPDCGGAFRWRHRHPEPHPGRSFLKAYSVPEGGGLISLLEAVEAP